LTVAVALAAGMLAQIVATHLGIPGIVLLLLTGVLLGPDVAGIVRPDALGPALFTLVNFAVAVILFEGALNLDLRRIRRQGRSIRALITLGATISAVGGTLAAHFVLGWAWRPSVLFGTLVIVTGPTVITPLLRRLRVEHSVSTLLEAEGVFGDAVGAVVALVALEVALAPTGEHLAKGPLIALMRLGVGGLFGLLGGALIALVLRARRLVPDGLETVLTLSLVLALFQVSNAVTPESGIAAVIAAGLVVGNTEFRVWRELYAFKEQLTVMLIGLLFVLLAAGVRMADLAALGAAGILTVVILMFVVRPLGVFLSTRGSGLSKRQKLFVAWIGPRGIVAAAIASYFASELGRAGIDGGVELRAMVFLVILVTVSTAGLGGGLVARLCGVSRPRDVGWVILGAKPVGCALAETLRAGGEEVVCIDSNPDACGDAEERGFKVLHANALEERTLELAEIDTRAGVIGVTPVEEVNLLFCQKAREQSRSVALYVALESIGEGVTPDMVRRIDGSVLFAEAYDVDAWNTRIDQGETRAERWRCVDATAANRPPDSSEIALKNAHRGLSLPLGIERAGRTRPVDEELEFREGDVLTVAINVTRAAEAEQRLASHGWVRVGSARLRTDSAA